MALAGRLYHPTPEVASGGPGSPRIAPAAPRPGTRPRAPAASRPRLARPAPASRTYLPPAIQRHLARAGALHLLPLLNLVAARSAGGEPCTAGQRELAGELGRTERQVRRGEAELERLGLVELERTREGRRGHRRRLRPTWFRAVELSTGSPQPVESPDMDVRWRGAFTGHACPVNEGASRPGPSTSARAGTRTKTENLPVSSGEELPTAAELARAPTPVALERLARAIGRWARMWPNTLPEVAGHLRALVRDEGPEAVLEWLGTLTRRLRYRDEHQRGALVLGALRARARQARAGNPGLFDRPMELLP